MDRRSHWQRIFREKAADQLTWYQAEPSQSLRLVGESGLAREARIIDVGGGTSFLANFLLDAGYSDLTVLDISRYALQESRRRLGEEGASVTWVEADATKAPFAAGCYDLWHDRAVFHFLVDPDERERYIRALHRSLRPGGYVVLATFAIDGPQQCSGLDVVRYGPEQIRTTFGDRFRLLRSIDELHRTPWDSTQKFTYFHLARP